MLHRPHRYTISLTFGALNAISDAFDRGFEMRNRLYRPWDANTTVCAAEWAAVGPAGDVSPVKGCFYDAVRADIAARPLQPRKCRRYGTGLCQHWSTVGCDNHDEDAGARDALDSWHRHRPCAVGRANSGFLDSSHRRRVARHWSRLARAYASLARVSMTVRTMESASRLVAEFPAEITVHLLDVLNRSQLLALAATFNAHGTAIDVLMTVAGINRTFELQKRVNAKSPFEVIDSARCAKQQDTARGRCHERPRA